LFAGGIAMANEQKVTPVYLARHASGALASNFLSFALS
jgi:hypothetical protein